MFAQSIEIKLRFDDFKTLTRSTRTVRPIQEATHILYYARQNLRRVHLQDRRLRLLGVKAAHLLDVGEYRQNPMYAQRSEEHTSELQSRGHLVCRLLLEE